MTDWQQSNWFRYMDEGMKELAGQSYELSEQERLRAGESKERDCSYIIFPMAKAYEGFLKKLFLDLKLISRQQYLGEHFRIGKALNPNLPKRYRSGWVWDKLTQSCGGETLPMWLWEAWRNGRNKIFHFFPDAERKVTLNEASDLINEMAMAMDKAVSGCGVDKA